MKLYNAKSDDLLLAIEKEYKKVSLEKYLSHKCRVLNIPYMIVWRVITGYPITGRNVRLITEKLSVPANKLFKEKI